MPLSKGRMFSCISTMPIVTERLMLSFCLRQNRWIRKVKSTTLYKLKATHPSLYVILLPWKKISLAKLYLCWTEHWFLAVNFNWEHSLLTSSSYKTFKDRGAQPMTQAFCVYHAGIWGLWPAAFANEFLLMQSQRWLCVPWKQEWKLALKLTVN